MKPTSEQKQPLEDSKEGLHTQGEWTWTNANSDDYIDIDCDGNRIASIFINPEFPEKKHEHKANAELIVRAVNERKALLDSHKELLSAMNLVLPMLENPKDADKYLFRLDIFKEAINNAKTVNHGKD